MFFKSIAMKKSFILPLIITALLASCSSTDIVVEPTVYQEPVALEETIPDTEESIVEEEAPEIAEPAGEEIPEVEEPVIEEVEMEPEIEEIAEPEVPEEEPKTVKEAFIESEEKDDDSDRILTGKALVEQITEDERAKKEDKLSVSDVVEPKVEAEPEEVVEVPSAVQALEPVETVEEVEKTPVEVEVVKAPSVDVVEDEAPVETAAVEKEENSIFDKTIDGRIVSIVVEIISIMVIFALSTVIRNKYSRPLHLGLSFLLAGLFTAIPMLIAFLLSGWSNLHLSYLLLLFTVFIFSSKRGH